MMEAEWHQQLISYMVHLDHTVAEKEPHKQRGQGNSKDSCKSPSGKQDTTKAVLRIASS